MPGARLAAALGVAPWSPKGETMRIKVINPNTTASMTRSIARAAAAVAASGTEIMAVSLAMGPSSIEGHYDEAVSALGVLDEVRKGEGQGVDGYVIACFGDPGLLAAREAARGPVIGIAEAAMHAASFIATGFSVVTTLERTCVIARHLAEAYDMARFCRGFRATDLTVLDLERMASNARDIVIGECRRRALTEDRSDAIVLGCAGTAELAATISLAIGAPVISGLEAAVKIVESLVVLGLRTSKLGGFAPPLAKRYVGLVEGFAPRTGVAR
jgi:allantoin racemase